jgi:pimeloyl-ACP methyl ester carboxylesterase
MARAAKPRGERHFHSDTLPERIERERHIERVAVVFTHGQGEQSPMSDVIELANSLWVTNEHVRNALAGEKGGVWSVPIFDGEMSEQRRLVTGQLPGMGRPIRRGGRPRDLQVDFYQFYWADLMSGNKFRHLWTWFQRLMKRKGRQGREPWDETPEALKPIRRFIMRAGFVVGLFGFLYGLITLARITPLEPVSWPMVYAVLLGGTLLVQGWALSRPARRTFSLFLGLNLTVASLVLGLYATELLGGRKPLIDDPPTGLDQGYVVMAHHVFTALIVGLVYVGWRIVLSARDSFLVPVMADSARMFSPDPENVPNRDRIRKRGMELLEAIHNSERRYDRIVVVAHSLGTAVAYNTLSQYWGNVHRLFNHAALDPEREAVETAAHRLEVAASAAERADKRLAANKDPARAQTRITAAERAAECHQQRLVRYRAKVRAYCHKLMSPAGRLSSTSVEWRTADFTSPVQLMRRLMDKVDGRRPAPNEYLSPWRITDFITCGSPLTYASLLLADRDAEFVTSVARRGVPLSPPHIRSGDTSFAHNSAPHHAALFGVTCWTNLYFPVEGPAKGDWAGSFVHLLTGASVKGDIVGGKLAGPPPKGLGHGILDIEVERHPNMPDFAHSEYWRWPAGVDPCGPVPQHLEVLRRAVRLIEDGTDQDDYLTKA